MNKKIDLKDIGGYEYQKKEAEKIVNFFRNYDSYVKNGASLPRGIIFYGRPGTGKTMFATAIANESKVKLYSLTDEKFYDNANVALSVHKTFEEARKNSPSIVLIDELDQLVACNDFFMREVSDKQREMLRLLLTEIDKLNNSGVLVIATSNTELRAIPSALVRNGRIEKHISISTPDFDDRKSIIDLYLSKNGIFNNIKSSELAKITNGFTGSSISSLVNDVLIKCLTNKRKNANYEDFYEPIQAIISHGIKRKPKKNNSDVIYHEIGHLIANYALKKEVGMINIECYGSSEGRFYKAGKEEFKDLSTLKDYEMEGTISMAGLAATEVFMGEKYCGASSDIMNVQSIFHCINAQGLLNFDLTSEAISDNRDFGGPKASSTYQTSLTRFLNECYKRAKSILVNNRLIVDELFNNLKEKKYMSTEEVQKVLNKFKIVDFDNEKIIRNDDLIYSDVVVNVRSKNEIVTISNLSKKYGIGFTRAKAVFDELINDKIIDRNGEVICSYKSK